MLPLGTTAPDFFLPNSIDDRPYSFFNLRSPVGTVVMFLCNHCPYVVFINEALVALAKEYQQKGFAFVGISSNNAEKYPADSYENMKIHAAEVGYPFPYLYDATQEVARAYDAACTPDFYVFDGHDKLVYRGQIDSARPSNDKIPDGSDLCRVLDALISGEPIDTIQRPSAGCNIKWK
jgi:thiol-disulfide isomerase/thioredoxin